MKRVALALLAGLLAVTLIFVLGPWQDDPVLDTGDTGAAEESNQPVTDQRGKVDGPALTEGQGDGPGGDDRESLEVASIKLRGRLIDHEGEPVAGTNVELRLGNAVSSPWVVFNTGSKPADATVTTDGSGDFDFDVPVGKSGRVTLGDEELVWKKKAPRFLGSESDLALGELAVAVGARLSGRIVNENEAPIEGVTLMYSNYQAYSGRMRQVKSDRDGRFELRGLSAGPSYLNVTRAGYVGFHRQYDLALGETKRDLVLKMRSGDVLLGKVVDDRGQPIADAKITAHGNGRNVNGGYEYSNCNTKTDKKGEFRASGLGNGPFNFTVTATGHIQANKQKVKVGDGPLHFKLTRMGTVAGTITDERGEAVGGGRVHFTTKAPTKKDQSEGEQMMSMEVALLDGSIVSHSYRHNHGRGVKVDDKGAFELKNIRPGRIWLIASGSHQRTVHGPIDVTAGQVVTDVAIAVKRGGVVTVTVLDPDGNPVEGAQVRLNPKSAKAGNGLPTNSVIALNGTWTHAPVMSPGMMVTRQSAKTGKTDEDGRCEIAGLTPGAFKASATQKQWVAPKSKAVELGKSGRAEVELQMVAGGRIAARILDVAGKPVAEQSFRIQRPAKPGVDSKGKPFKPSVVKTGKVDATGRATLGPLAPGHYEAVVMANSTSMGHLSYGWMSHNYSTTGKLLSDPVPFKVEPRKTTEVVMTKPRLASLSGTVRDSGGGVAGGRVLLVPARNKKEANYFNLTELGSAKKATCDPHGNYEIDNLQAGAYDVAILRKQGGVQFLFKIDVVGANAQRKDFFLATGEVTVKLTLDGKPVEGVSVMLMSVGNDASNAMMYVGNQSRSPSAKTDADGVATLRGIPSDSSFRVHVSSKKYTFPKQEPFKVEAGGAAERAIALGRAARVEMTILRVTDQPPSGSVRIEMKSDATGKSKKRWVTATKPVTQTYAAGTYQVRAQRQRDESGKRGGWSQWQPVELTPGQTAKVRIIVP